MTVALATVNYAFDKQSARSFDAEGRMRVRNCTISVAEINPYYGKEIPGWEKLGLDPNAVYDMYRDPVELERGADSFNGMSLMVQHIAQTAKEPRKEYIGGSVINPRFNRDTGQLITDLFVFDGKAIEYVESDELTDLSSSYRYTPDMTPGEIGGRKYHGVMRNIQANHVALVKDGRATGAHVADSALIPQTGATNVDPNLIPNDPNAGAGAAAPTDLAAVAQALLMLTQVIEQRLPAPGAAPAEKPAIAVDPSAAAKADDEDPDKKDDEPPAMDAKAVQALVDASVKAGVDAERARAQAVETAKRECRGDLGDMIALDSAGDIYRAALKQRGVDVSAIPAGTEQVAFQASNAAVGRGAVAHANDAARDAAKRATFDTSRLRVRG